MNEPRTLEQAIHAWLREDSREAIDGILDAVLGSLDAYPQRQRRVGLGGLLGRPMERPIVARSRSLAFLVAALALTLLAISLLPVAFPPTVRESMPPSASPVAPAFVEPTAGQPSSPPPSILPTLSPTTVPTTSGPAPGPTLDWESVGYTIEIRSPVVRGTPAFVSINAPVGPTCAIEVRYPGGARATIGPPMRPSATRWRWSWFVPVGTPLGAATVETTCTYHGLAKSGAGTLLIVDDPPPPTFPAPTPPPTLPPTWSITGDVNSPVGAGSTLTFSGHVHGTPPPGDGPVDLSCTFTVAWPGGFDQSVSDGGVSTRDFPLAMTIANNPSLGTFSWSTTCQARNGTQRSTSGVVTVQ